MAVGECSPRIRSWRAQMLRSQARIRGLGRGIADTTEIYPAYEVGDAEGERARVKQGGDGVRLEYNMGRRNTSHGMRITNLLLLAARWCRSGQAHLGMKLHGLKDPNQYLLRLNEW